MTCLPNSVVTVLVGNRERVLGIREGGDLDGIWMGWHWDGIGE